MPLILLDSKQESKSQIYEVRPGYMFWCDNGIPFSLAILAILESGTRSRGVLVRPITSRCGSNVIRELCGCDRDELGWPYLGDA